MSRQAITIDRASARSTFMIGLLAVATSGCVLYATPEGAGVASIGPDDRIMADGDAYLYIEKIDGKRVTWSRKPPKRIRSEQSSFSVKIVPGKRQATIRACAVTEFGEHRCTRARLHVLLLPNTENLIQARFTEQLDSVDLWLLDLNRSSTSTSMEQVEIKPCSELAASNPLRAYIICDRLDIVDVFFEPK